MLNGNVERFNSMWPLVIVYIEGLAMTVTGGEHREWHCLVWHV